MTRNFREHVVPDRLAIVEEENAALRRELERLRERIRELRMEPESIDREFRLVRGGGGSNAETLTEPPTSQQA